MSTIAELDPRRDMGLIRERIGTALSNAEDLRPILRDLANRNPVALAELVIGPKAQTAPPWIRAVLSVIEVLEASLATGGLYRRLVALNEQTQIEVLQVAARRHPSASWLIALSRTVEGKRAGEIHLGAAIHHPAFAQNCWAHASAGHLPGLIAIALQTGRAEPAAALTAHDHLEAAGLALVNTLTHSPNSPVVAMMAAAWGPDLSPVLHKALPKLRSRTVAVALSVQVNGYPSFQTFLKTLISAMVKT
jgi:hypothetical protein